MTSDLLTFILNWSMPVLLAMLTVLGALQFLDAFGIVYYPLINRVARTMTFDLGRSMVAPLLVLLLLWLVWMIRYRQFKALLFPTISIIFYPFFSCEASVSMASMLAVVGGLYINRYVSKYITVVLSLLSGIEAMALIHWIFFVPFGIHSPFLWVAEIEMALFYLVALVAPLFVLFFMYLWILKPLLHRLYKGKYQLKKWKNGDRVSVKAILLLLLSVSLSVVAVLYPNLPSMNPTNRNLGVDYLYYVEKGEIVENEFSQVFNISSGSRPLIFITIHAVKKIFMVDTSVAVRYLPLLLNPLLIASIFFFTVELLNDEWVAAWAAFFTVCGYHITVGMFAYFISNMLALSFIYFSLGFLFRALSRESCWSLAFASVFGSLVNFTHPWTFDHYLVAIIFLSGLAWYRAKIMRSEYKKFKMILLYIFSLGFSEVFHNIIMRGYGGVNASSTIIRRSVGLHELWSSTVFFLKRSYSGSESIVLLFGLAILGYYVLRLQSVKEDFLISFMVVTSIPFLFSHATLKSRLIYNIPLGLYTSIGFLWLLKQKMTDDFKLPLSNFIVLNAIVYLFRSLANFI